MVKSLAQGPHYPETQQGQHSLKTYPFVKCTQKNLHSHITDNILSSRRLQKLCQNLKRMQERVRFVIVIRAAITTAYKNRRNKKFSQISTRAKGPELLQIRNALPAQAIHRARAGRWHHHPRSRRWHCGGHCLSGAAPRAQAEFKALRIPRRKPG